MPTATKPKLVTGRHRAEHLDCASNRRDHRAHIGDEIELRRNEAAHGLRAETVDADHAADVEGAEDAVDSGGMVVGVEGQLDVQ